MARDLRVKVRLQADTKQATSRINSFKGSIISLGTVVKGAAVAGALAIFTTAIRGLSGDMRAAVDAAKEQEDSIKQLDSALKSLGPAAASVSAALQEQASSLQKVTRFGDEETIRAQAQLALFVKSEGALKALTVATQDFATAQGISLVNAAQLVAKTIGSSTNALIRYGVEVEGAAGSTDRALSAVKSLSELMGGQATDAANTFAGAMIQLQNAQGDFGEILGSAVVGSDQLKSSLKNTTRETLLLNEELQAGQGRLGVIIAGWEKLKTTLGVDFLRVLNGIKKEQIETFEAMSIRLRQQVVEEARTSNALLLSQAKQSAGERQFQSLLDSRIRKEKIITDAVLLRENALAAAGLRTKDELQSELDATNENIAAIQRLGDIGELSFAQVQEGVSRLRIEQEALQSVLDGNSTSVESFKSAANGASSAIELLGQSTGEAGQLFKQFGVDVEESTTKLSDFGSQSRTAQDGLGGFGSSGIGSSRFTTSTLSGGTFSVRARSRSSQAFVNSAVAAGMRPRNGRIRGANGGSRLVR